jgi:hypothetical protein
VFCFCWASLEKLILLRSKNSRFKPYCLGVQALLEHWWAVGILEKLKWLFDENVYQNKMATHMTISITIFEERQVKWHCYNNL